MSAIQTYGVIDATCPAANREYDNAEAEIKQIDDDWEASDVKSECLKILGRLHDFNHDLRDDLRKALEGVYLELQDLKKLANELCNSADEALDRLNADYEPDRLSLDLDYDIKRMRMFL